PLHHGDPVHRRRDARRVRAGAAAAQGVGVRPRRNHLGGGLARGAALYQGRRCRRHHARPGSRARRDDGGDFRHRQRAPARRLAQRAGQQHRLGARQRIHRGSGRHLLFLADRARPDPVPDHHRGARALQAAADAPGAPGRDAHVNAIYRARRRTNLVLLTISGFAVLFGLFWLAWILGTLFYEGGHALARATLYYQMTPPPGADGGLANAIAGSALLIAVGTLLGTPIGILAGTYLAEFGKRSWLANATRFLNDVLLAAPS